MINRKTQEFDATGQVLGRLATKIATILMGKDRPDYTPNIDSGDFVVVLNPGKIKFTGNKLDQKVYIHHSMHPGGLKTVPAKKLLAERPNDVIKKAVSRMLPKNKMHVERMKRLSFK